MIALIAQLFGKGRAQPGPQAKSVLGFRPSAFNQQRVWLRVMDINRDAGRLVCGVAV